MINPITTKLFRILIIAKRMTIIPAVLKNIPEFLLSLILNELKLTRVNTGRVPKAKANIVKAPLKKFPVERVYICIDWVNPHGKKNVAMPTKRGVKE